MNKKDYQTSESGYLQKYHYILSHLTLEIALLDCVYYLYFDDEYSMIQNPQEIFVEIRLLLSGRAG